jgi:hypothetical protein
MADRAKKLCEFAVDEDMTGRYRFSGEDKNKEQQ